MAQKRKIFVFGSNLAGRHGRGSAREAVKNHGAIYGQGMGLQGNSYAIPTKDKKLNILPLERIKNYVDEFLSFAENHPDMEFEVVKIGCGLAGYKEEEIKPLFWTRQWTDGYKWFTPTNVILPSGWRKCLVCRGYRMINVSNGMDYDFMKCLNCNFTGFSDERDWSKTKRYS